MTGEIDIILKYKRLIAAIGTILFGFLLLLLFLLIIFSTPIPPFPDAMTGGGGGSLGIEVNLGNSEDGIGEIQSDKISAPKFELKTAIAANNPDDDNNLMTQNNDESASINDKKDKKTEIKKNAEALKEDKKNNTEENTEPEINRNALFKSNKGNNQGTTGNPGDQGKTGGTIYSNSYKGDGGGGDGTGPGKGGGDGSGIGDGVGDGNGPGKSNKGIVFSLAGRKSKLLPAPEYPSDEQGKVVVEVTVDKEGKVTKAIPGAIGTTTNNQQLWEAAKKAALNARFDKKSDAPTFQKGTITYRFIIFH